MKNFGKTLLENPLMRTDIEDRGTFDYVTNSEFKNYQKKLQQERRRQPKVTGGLVSGPEVPFTQEDPADRINPMTGEPYQEQMSRLGFAEGGEINNFDMKRFLKHLKDREGDVDKVYLDSLGHPTAGVGHKLTEEELKLYKVGDVVPVELRNQWLKNDSNKALAAARLQAKNYSVDNGKFIEALGNVNFQLGSSWEEKFPAYKKAMLAGNREEAIKQIQIGTGKEGQSKWKEQTPVRVQDYVEALLNLE